MLLFFVLFCALTYRCVGSRIVWKILSLRRHFKVKAFTAKVRNAARTRLARNLLSSLKIADMSMVPL